MTLRAGEPLIVGGEFELVAARTEIENAGNDAVLLPSLTLITMFEYVPTLLLVGRPLSVPVEVLKLAHEGRFVIE